MRKIYALILASTMTVFLLAGSVSAAEVPDDTVIGLMLSDESNEFFSTLKDSVISYLSDYEVISYNANNDASEDITNMEDLLTKEPDAIIYNPVDADAGVEAVMMANDAGVPVITVDRSVSDGDVVCHIASDNVYGGELAANYIVDQLGDEGGEVVEIQGQAGASATNERGEGFHNVMDENDSIDVVVSQTGNWDTTEAMTIMENALTSNPDVAAVFCHNDVMALGAMEACQAAGRDDIVIVGFDADDANIQAIIDGTQSATIQQIPAEMGEVAAQAALDTVAGEEVEPSIGVEVNLITIDNAE